MASGNSKTTSSEAVRECSKFRNAAYDVTKGNDLMRENVVQCLSIMMSHPQREEVQNSATLALMALCEKRNLEEFIGEIGGMEALLVSWNRFRSREGIVKNMFVLFRSLLMCLQNRQRFRIHGGLKLLVTSMKLHSRSAGIQRVSCLLVTVLSSDPEVHRFRIVESGVIRRVAEALSLFDKAKDARLQLSACAVLGNLTSDLSQCKKVVDADLELTGIVHIIRKRPDPEVVYSAQAVFRNVMAHHQTLPFPLVTVRIITSTLLSFLKESSRMPTKYGRCHEVAFAMLRSRLVSDDHIIPEDYFLSMCLSYTKTYLQTGEIQDHAVVGHACACIRIILFAACHRVAFERIPNSIETLVQAIVELSSRPIRVEQALLALGNAVFDSEEAQRRVDVADGLRIIAETMKENDFSATVTIAGFQALHAICANNYRTTEKATSLSIQELCVNSLHTFKDNPHIQESGLATIAMLGQTENGARALHRSSALKAARRASEQFPYSRKILLLTERIRSLVEGLAFPGDASTVDSEKRENLASRLFRKLSSRLTPSE